MDNTALALTSPQPAYELFYRMIEGAQVSGAEVIASLGADIEKGYLVGGQSILTLVRDNPLVGDADVRLLITLLEAGGNETPDADAARAYRIALRECREELARRAAGSGKVVPLR